MQPHTMNGITIQRDPGQGRSFVTIRGIWEYRCFYDENEAYEFARKLHAAQLLDHFFASIKRDENKPLTLGRHFSRSRRAMEAMYYANARDKKNKPRDYNHERGEFPRVDTPKPQPKPVKIDRANEQAKETLRRLTKLYKGKLEFKDGDLVDVEKPGKPKGNGKPENPLHKEWKKLQEKERNGETYPYRTPPIPRSEILTVTSIHPLTPHQQMRQAIRDAINVAPLPSEWRDDKYTLALPFGMKLGRHGGDEVAVWGNYLPKGKRYKTSTKSVVVGYLKGDRFVAIEDCMMFEKALSKVMEIITEHGLNKPTPPTSPASNPVQVAA